MNKLKRVREKLTKLLKNLNLKKARAHRKELIKERLGEFKDRDHLRRERDKVRKLLNVKEEAFEKIPKDQLDGDRAKDLVEQIGGFEARLKSLNARISENSNLIQRLAASISKWGDKINHREDRFKALTLKRKKVERKIAEERKRQQQQQQQTSTKVTLSSGATHWGGSDDILRNEVEPVAKAFGFSPNSAKRSETYGNPGSDHHTSQVTASARDFPTATNYALGNAIKRKLTGNPSAVMVDYENFYITRAGTSFRVQIIAGTHGTGPHLHVGVRR